MCRYVNPGDLSDIERSPTDEQAITWTPFRLIPID